MACDDRVPLSTGLNGVALRADIADAGSLITGRIGRIQPDKPLQQLDRRRGSPVTHGSFLQI